MPDLWGRTIKLSFGVKGETGVVIDTSKIPPNRAIPGISFDITKTIKNKNTATITIYNLQKSNRDIVSSAKHDTLFCILEVGYGGDNFIIFKGVIQTAYNAWSGFEWATSFTVVDGKKTKKVKVNLTFPPKTDMKQMLTDTFKGLGGKFEGVILDVKKEISQNGVTLSGSFDAVIEGLTNMMPSQDLEQTVQDEVVYVKPVDTFIDANNVPIVSYQTGMIGSPRITKKGIEFTSLLQKGLSPGRGVEIISISGESNGYYAIQKTKAAGALRGDKWQIWCQATATDKIERVPISDYGDFQNV